MVELDKTGWTEVLDRILAYREARSSENVILWGYPLPPQGVRKFAEMLGKQDLNWFEGDIDARFLSRSSADVFFSHFSLLNSLRGDWEALRKLIEESKKSRKVIVYNFDRITRLLETIFKLWSRPDGSADHDSVVKTIEHRHSILNREGLKLVGREFGVGSVKPDLLFRTKNGGFCVVEVETVGLRQGVKQARQYEKQLSKAFTRLGIHGAVESLVAWPRDVDLDWFVDALQVVAPDEPSALETYQLMKRSGTIVNLSPDLAERLVVRG